MRRATRWVGHVVWPELLLEECSDEVRQAMQAIVDQMTEEQLSDPLMLNSGRCCNWNK